MVDAADDRMAGSVTVQLVLVNRSDFDIEYHVESVAIGLQTRVAEGPAVVRAPTRVEPGGLAIVSCPTVRGVDRTGPSSGNVDYVLVYGRPDDVDGAANGRYRRRHGIWFRLENLEDGTMQARFIERYDLDDRII